MNKSEVAAYYEHWAEAWRRGHEITAERVVAELCLFAFSSLQEVVTLNDQGMPVTATGP